MKKLRTYFEGFSGFVTHWVTDFGIVFAVQIRERERERERERSNQRVTLFKDIYHAACVIFDTAVFLCPVSRFFQRNRHTGIGFRQYSGRYCRKLIRQFLV